MSKRFLAIGFTLAHISGCGGGSVSGSLVNKYLSEEQIKVPTAVEPTPEQANPAPYDEVTVNNTTYATIPESETRHILTTVNFLFDTARAVHLKIDMPEIDSTQSNISICTDFSESDKGYSVKYNSCLIKASMDNGQFQHHFEIMNHYDSALAVVWFPNQEFDTLYKVLTFSDTTANEYVWNGDGIIK